MSEETDFNQKKLIHDLRVNELRAELEKRSLDKTGVKATLIERLEKALKSEGHDVGTFAFNNNNAEASPTIAVVEGNAPADVVPKITTNAAILAEPVTAAGASPVVSDENGNVKDAEASKTTTNDSEAVASTTNDDNGESVERDHIIIGSPVSVFPSGDDVTSGTTGKANDLVATSTEPTSTTTTVDNEMDTNESAAPAASTPVVNSAPVDNKQPTPAAETTVPIAGSTPLAETAGNNNAADDTAALATPATTNTSTTDASGAAMIKKEQVSPVKKSADDSAASVWIRGISNSTKAADLKTLFSKHGKVVAAKIFTTKNKLAPTCFGYITMADVNSANVCIQKLNRTNLKGKVITVEKISKAGRIAASALNTTTTAAASGSPAPATTLKTSVTAPKPAASVENTAEKPVDAAPSASATGGESPEIIFEDVRTKSAASTSGEKTDDGAQKESGDQQSASGKKTVRPRIVASKDAARKTAPRKIRPPADASAPKINHTTRTAKNISRRVLNTSNARYRGGVAPHGISRASYHSSVAGNAPGPVRRFATRSVGGSVQRVFNGPVRTGYRGKPHIGPGQRFSNRNGPPAPPSSSYTRSSHHSGRNSLDGGVKISSWERNELLMTMRQREDEYRKKEEELKLQRERERLKFERERLEREKLEIQQMKLTAQLASAQMALIPGAAGGAAVDYGAVSGVFNKPTKPSSSTSKKHSESSAGDSRRDPRGREPAERRPSSKAHGRAHSRSRSPHHRLEHGSASFKRGGATMNYTRGRPTSTRYGDSSKRRYDAPHFSSSAKHQSASSAGCSGRGASSRDRARVSGGDVSHSSTRFSYGSNDSPSGGYSRGYQTAGSSAGRNHSPVRRGTVDRSSGASRDSYTASGVQRFIDDELRGVSQYIARTDPSYASRVGGSGVGGGSSSGMGVSADEMFGLTGGSSSSAAANYYGSRLSGGGEGGYRDSLPSTYQATLSTAGSSGLQWSSGGGGSRSSYLADALETSGSWQTGYQNASASGRSGWNSDYVPGSGEHYSGSGRYNSGTASGGSYSSRRY